MGELSAKAAVSVVRVLFSRTLWLPQLHERDGIIGGHSMGGHGAWVLGLNSPDRFVCAAVSASWIKKEEYGQSNAFFLLDVSNSYISPALKGILERSSTEYHVDRLTSNFKHLNVHVSVGGDDAVTHAWYSRRMHRLLLSQGVNSTVTMKQLA